MSDLIDRQKAIEAIEFGITYVKAINKETGEVKELFQEGNDELRKAAERIKQLPSAEPQERKTEKALRLLLEWAIECDFGYDNIPEEYEKYKDDIEGMSYTDGLIYIAMREVEHG